MIQKTTKIDYKQKTLLFEDGVLHDENGEIINLEDELNTVFGDNEFTLTASISKKSEYEVEDFKK